VLVGSGYQCTNGVEFGFGDSHKSYKTAMYNTSPSLLIHHIPITGDEEEIGGGEEGIGGMEEIGGGEVEIGGGKEEIGGGEEDRWW